MDYYYSETLMIDKYPGIHLLQDHIGTNYGVPWDDFGYIITFKVYYVRDIDKIKIGNIKMLSKANENTSLYFKEHGEEIELKIININGALSENKLVSIGEDIDYYKNKPKVQCSRKMICQCQVHTLWIQCCSRKHVRSRI